MHSKINILKTLKFLDYPDCVHKSLDFLSTTKNDKNLNIPGLNEYSDDLISQIVLDYIFTHAKSSHQYHKFKVPSFLRELQTLDIILKKFSLLKDSLVANQLFQSLFKECQSNDVVLTTLQKCVSFAVGLKNMNFLNSTAFWMMEQGCSCNVVLNVCDYLLDDYCKMTTDISPLKDLPNISQIFTCCLIICLTNSHTSSVNSSMEVILDLIADWLLSDPSLGLSSLNPATNEYLKTKQRQTLWTSPSKPNNQTPIPGLVLWLAKQTASLHINNEASELPLILSKLHLSILQTILSFPTLPGYLQLDLFTLSDMQRILNDVNSTVKQTGTTRKRILQDGDPEEKPATPACPPQVVELVGERLSQILQVGLATGAFRCAITDLQAICALIPNCLLLQILKNQHLSASTPLMHNANR